MVILRLRVGSFAFVGCLAAPGQHDGHFYTILTDGFYDHSKFISKAKHFTGMTPRVFAEQPTLSNRQIAKCFEPERLNPMLRSAVIT